MKKLNIIDRESKKYQKQLEKRAAKVTTLENIRLSLLEKRSGERRKILIKALSTVRD